MNLEAELSLSLLLLLWCANMITHFKLIYPFLYTFISLFSTILFARMPMNFWIICWMNWLTYWKKSHVLQRVTLKLRLHLKRYQMDQQVLMPMVDRRSLLSPGCTKISRFCCLSVYLLFLTDFSLLEWRQIWCSPIFIYLKGLPLWFLDNKGCLG